MNNEVTVLSKEQTFSVQELPQTTQLPVLANPIHRSRDYLLSLQSPEGYWQAPFEMDVRQTAEYIFLKHILDKVDKKEEHCMANYILRSALPGGGWTNYYGGPPDISTTITAYYGLRLAGIEIDHPVLQRAKEVIMDQGGIMQANCFTRNYLMMFGQMHPNSLPAMPVEIMLLPKWFPFNLYAISSWTRGILVPLLMIAELRKTRKPTPGPSCDELYPEDCDPKIQPLKRTKKLLTWHNFFLLADRVFKTYEKRPIRWLRKRAMGEAHKWLAEHMGRPGGLAALFPSMVNSCIAMLYLGYDANHPLIANELKALESLKIEEQDYAWIQPCLSTMWDTIWCLKILPELGISPSHPKLVKAKEFLLSKQVSQVGDWQEKIPPVPCGAWYFQMENTLYPDTDDTAAALLALSRYSEEQHVNTAAERAINWLFAMQSRDGGWAAFDYQERVYDCFNYIPFADHGALLDPPTADVTARVIEALAAWGYDISDANIKRAVTWMLNCQETDGSWYGRWGVNYIYGTWAVLCGLEAVGYDMQKEPIRKAMRWLLDHQRPDGGWGESCASYPNASQKGQGDSTPSQTAWALMGLNAAGCHEHPAVLRGVQYLLKRQQPEGNWQEEFFTGTGFPGVCYLRYHFYRDHFPALALARILPKISGRNATPDIAKKVS